jgi:hypothetical protein
MNRQIYFLGNLIQKAVFRPDCRYDSTTSETLSAGSPSNIRKCTPLFTSFLRYPPSRGVHAGVAGVEASIRVDAQLDGAEPSRLVELWEGHRALSGARAEMRFGSSPSFVPTEDARMAPLRVESRSQSNRTGHENPDLISQSGYSRESVHVNLEFGGQVDRS